MKIYKVILVICMGIALNANNLIIKSSNYSVEKTIKKIEKIVKLKGMNVFGIINHQKAAQKVGLTMNEAQVIIFGNPKLGTKLMQKDIKVALELPLKILVYSNNSGQTKVEYMNPMQYANIYDLKGLPLLSKMQQALDKITSKASE